MIHFLFKFKDLFVQLWQRKWSIINFTINHKVLFL